MKIKKIAANNRKKCFEVSTAKETFLFPFSSLPTRPTSANPVAQVFIDAELGNEAFTYRLRSGKESSVHLDQVLEYNQDPDYQRQMLLYKLSLKAQKILSSGKIKKREIIRRMHTSPAQFYRLLDQANYTKTIDQMVKLLGALDCPVDVVFRTSVAA